MDGKGSHKHFSHSSRLCIKYNRISFLFLENSLLNFVLKAIAMFIRYYIFIIYLISYEQCVTAVQIGKVMFNTSRPIWPLTLSPMLTQLSELGYFFSKVGIRGFHSY